MFGYIVPGVVADQHEVIAIEQSRCQVFIRQQMSLRGRRDEIPKFFDNPVMSGRRGGYLSYNACGTVSRFQQCPCVVEQEESSSELMTTNVLEAFTKLRLMNTPTSQLLRAINILVLSFSNAPG